MVNQRKDANSKTNQKIENVSTEIAGEITPEGLATIDKAALDTDKEEHAGGFMAKKMAEVFKKALK